jgi:hypothetical protein
MKDAFVPLIAAAGAFFAVVVWRVRPVVLWRTRRLASRGAFREVQGRIEAAKSGAERARALCDAGDLLAAHVRSRGSATAMYLRAIRADPGSVEVVERAVATFARRPHALESLLWRQLATARWSESRDATHAALDALRALYDGPLRSPVRARALTNARESLV